MLSQAPYELWLAEHSINNISVSLLSLHLFVVVCCESMQQDRNNLVSITDHWDIVLTFLELIFLPGFLFTYSYCIRIPDSFTTILQSLTIAAMFVTVVISFVYIYSIWHLIKALQFIVPIIVHACFSMHVFVCRTQTKNLLSWGNEDRGSR